MSRSNLFHAFLHSEFERRKMQNPKYSLRAYARHLSIDASLLSKILSDQILPSLKLADRVLKTLKVPEVQRSYALEHLGKSIIENKKIKVGIDIPQAKDDELRIENDLYQVLGNLCHYAILELMNTKGAKSDHQWIAKKLGLTRIEVDQAIARLKQFGLLKEENGRYIKTAKFISTKDKSKTSHPLRNQQRQGLKLGLYGLENVAIEKRSNTGMTMAIDPKKIPIAKKMISDFNRQMTDILASDECSQVYQLNISLVPIIDMSVVF